LADWTNATDTSGLPLTYIYQSANSAATTSSGSFASPVYTSTSPLTDSEQPTPGTPEGTWYWHVQTSDAAGNVSAWTDAWKVIVNNSTSSATTTEGTGGNEGTTTATTTATTTDESNNQGNTAPGDDLRTGGQRTGGGGFIPGFSFGQGSVLGAFTTDESSGASCKSDTLLTKYMRLGAKNDPAEVRKLQIFLNGQNLGITLPVTGFFGIQTDKAVRAFQLKFAEQILGPWVDAGLYPSKSIATGYVYKTTLRWINMQICKDLNTPIPTLN